MNVQTQINRIQNELKALKATSPLNIGALEFPDHAPTASYSGTMADVGISADYVVASFEATFTRSDGVPNTPFVDFAFNVELHPNYVEEMAEQGVAITGNDPNAENGDPFVHGQISESGSNYVKFLIEVVSGAFTYAHQTATVALTVQALSTVEGTLTLTRTK